MFGPPPPPPTSNLPNSKAPILKSHVMIIENKCSTANIFDCNAMQCSGHKWGCIRKYTPSALGKSLGPRGVYIPIIHPSSRHCTSIQYPYPKRARHPCFSFEDLFEATFFLD